MIVSFLQKVESTKRNKTSFKEEIYKVITPPLGKRAPQFEKHWSTLDRSSFIQFTVNSLYDTVESRKLGTPQPGSPDNSITPGCAEAGENGVE
ncbi:hypothetical protein TNCV_1019651 [Trichonephila clavipes]|nr:hypothetical protein TNCV_1019651 [Trichonephila clavipes]